MCRIDLDTVTPLGLHLCERHLRLFQQQSILNVSEANRDTRRIAHSMSFHVDDVALECPGRRTKNQLDFVLGLHVQARQLCRRVLKRLGYSSEPLAITEDL